MPSFVEIGPVVSGEEVFFTIYGHGGHLGYLTWITFCLPSYNAFNNFALIGQAVSEKKIFEDAG